MNLIPVIREALGLEANEEFRIKYYKSELFEYKFRFTNNIRLEKLYNDDWLAADSYYLLGLIHGQYEVVKMPFKPKEGEDYYFVDVSTGYVCRTTYGLGYRHDVVRIREALRVSSGNCYQTGEGAEKHVDEWMSKIYGENWKELLK